MNIIKTIVKKIIGRPSLEFCETINEGDGSCGKLYYKVCNASSEALVDNTHTPVVAFDENGKSYIPLADGNRFYINRFQVRELDRFREKFRGY